MSTVTYLVTIVAALLGVFVLGETLSIWQVAGGLVLLGGVWLTSRVDL
jgi:drug/metabolite transporter (DMT)-like permease